jgi:hypothetical protein
MIQQAAQATENGRATPPRVQRMPSDTHTDPSWPINPTGNLGARALIALQQSAGNIAARSLLIVQRCGATSHADCSCQDTGDADRADDQPHQFSAQRAPADQVAPQADDDTNEKLDHLIAEVRRRLEATRPNEAPSTGSLDKGELLSNLQTLRARGSIEAKRLFLDRLAATTPAARPILQVQRQTAADAAGDSLLVGIFLVLLGIRALQSAPPPRLPTPRAPSSSVDAPATNPRSSPARNGQLSNLSMPIRTIGGVTPVTAMAITGPMADSVRQVSDAVEQVLTNSPGPRMRCSDEVIRFREARDQLLNALSRPAAQVGGIVVVRLRDAFQLAVNALLICLGFDPIF